MARFTRLCLLGLVLLSGCDSGFTEQDISLANLSLSAGQLAPAFSSTVTSYTALVGEDVSVITVTATAAESYALLKINEVFVNEPSGSLDVPLNLGANTITVAVTAFKNYDTKTRNYVVIVTRQAGSWSVGGTVSGLTGVLSLQNNGVDEIVLTDDGAFAFALPLLDGDSYDVIITAQPTGQTCNVVNAQGAVTGAAISNVTVTCVDTP
jgi:hypothetical protein